MMSIMEIKFVASRLTDGKWKMPPHNSTFSYPFQQTKMQRLREAFGADVKVVNVISDAKNLEQTISDADHNIFPRKYERTSSIYKITTFLVGYRKRP